MSDAKKEWSESHEGYQMNSQRVYLFVCPNCGREYIYPVGQTVRWCTECTPPASSNT